MPVGGLSIDMGGSGGHYAESATGLGTGIGTSNFIILVTRARYFTSAHYPFGIFKDVSNYILFNISEGTSNRLYMEWRGGGNYREVVFTTTSPNNNYTLSSGLISFALWRDGTTLKGGMIDAGGFSGTNNPGLIVESEKDGENLLSNHTWAGADGLDNGKYQLQRYNATQNGRGGCGPIFVIQFGASVWTEAQIEQALMDPSCVSELCIATGATIKAQFDSVNRSGSPLVTSSTVNRVALATGDVVVDAIAGKNMTYTAGTGTGYCNPPFWPVDRYASGAGRLHNVLYTSSPVVVADPDGGYWATTVTTNTSGFGELYLEHFDVNGVRDRHPIFVPITAAYYKAIGTNTRTTYTGGIYPGGVNGISTNMLPDYHAGITIELDGDGNIVFLPAWHSITEPTGGTATAPLTTSAQYTQGCPHHIFAPASRGDIDAVTGSLATLGKTLAPSGNQTIDYQQVGVTYRCAARVGDHVIVANRAGDGTNGYLVVQKFSGGALAGEIKVTNNNLTGTGAWPVAVVPLGANACAIVFTLRDGGLYGNATGLRCMVLDDADTFDANSFSTLTGSALSIPLSHSTMRTGPDTTGTDISGVGTASADVSTGHAIGDGNGLIVFTWLVGEGNNVDPEEYDGGNVKLMFRAYEWNGVAPAQSGPVGAAQDVTSLLPEGFFSASGKSNWANPFLVWVDELKTRAGLLITGPGAATMTPDGTGLGGCPLVDTWGTEVEALVLDRLSTRPRATAYGNLYTASGSVLSVDVHPQTGSGYAPFTWLQAYVGPGANYVGQCPRIPLSLTPLADLDLPEDSAGSRPRTSHRVTALSLCGLDLI